MYLIDDKTLLYVCCRVCYNKRIEEGDVTVSERIYRLHYRGQLKEGVSEGALKEATEQCISNVRQAQRLRKVLTAALYRYDRMLFFYYEALGEPLAVMEPISLAKEQNPKKQNLLTTEQPEQTIRTSDSQKQTAQIPGSQEQTAQISDTRKPVLESGEDVQSTCPYPDELLAALNPYLQVWPGQRDDRLWVHMYQIYYHNLPESVENWRRTAIPEKRRGRIAFLRDDKLFSYTYFHKAIVDEGLLTGDKYQSIALHENILFSYFEEPKSMVNVRNDDSRESEVIKDWLAVNPESHFIHMPEGKGENFMFLPALFAVGAEDIL